MTTKEIAFEIEELQVEAEKIHSLQNALFSAIYEGSSAPGTYEWAFIALGDLTLEVKNKLNDVTKKLFEIIKAERR